MDEDTKKVFDAIVNKDISAITPSDILFLRARQSYLTEEQLKLYSPLFDVQPKPRVEATQVPQNQPTELSMKELYKKAKALGCKTRLGMKRDELITMINNCYVL